MRTEEQRIAYDAVCLLETHGWIRGRLRSPNGFCIRGAVQMATDHPAALDSPVAELHHERRRFDRAYEIIRDHIVRTWGPIPSIPGWNDRRATQADIDRLIASVKAECAPEVAVVDDPTHEFAIN